MSFKIHPQIEKDSEFIIDLELSQLRILKDGDNDWFVLIPRKEGVIDWDDLDENELTQLNSEIVKCTKLLKQNLELDKVNVANLGNMVSQFHVHIIARYKSDRAWPGPIWGTKASNTYQSERALFWQQKFANH